MKTQQYFTGLQVDYTSINRLLFPPLNQKTPVISIWNPKATCIAKFFIKIVCALSKRQSIRHFMSSLDERAYLIAEGLYFGKG